MIENTIKDALNKALDTLGVQEETPELEVPNDQNNGDFSTNIALKLARVLKRAPMQIADEIVKGIDLGGSIKRIEVAKPGFINFYVNKTIYHDVIHTINTLQTNYGNSTLGQGEHYNIEFVSANPTGSLHIGHARGAAAGDALTRILKKAGYQVTKEFYVNDGGNQIHNLALSINARYKQHFGQDVSVPEDGYHGKELFGLTAEIVKTHGARFLKEDGYTYFKSFGVDYLLNALRETLKAFNVEFDVWFHETTLYKENQLETTLKALKDQGFAYEEDGALWLKTSQFGDEKDRVIIKSDGSYTYILPDIAYHNHKLSRGYTKLIDILGSDHHGYVPRLNAAIEMIGGRSDLLAVDLLQMVKVMQDGEELKMSKRSGKTITLADLIEDIGPGPIRYFFAMRSLNTQMELDLDLALKQTTENPYYYAQYAHARIVSLFKTAQDKGIDVDPKLESFTTLNTDKVNALLTVLVDYPRVIEEAAEKRIPHKITQYIHRLAQTLHSFYAAQVVINSDLEATKERLALLNAVKIVLKDALNLIGVDAKDHM